MQRFPSGRELPIEYTTVRVAGEQGGLLALGKNLQAVAELQSRLVAAQQATEREYWKLREVETRYRLLFDASNEAVLMIGGDDLRIIEANPAAVRALGWRRGWDFCRRAGAEGARGVPGHAAAGARAGPRAGHRGASGPGDGAWTVRASLMTAEPGLRYMLHARARRRRPARSAARNRCRSTS